MDTQGTLCRGQGVNPLRTWQLVRTHLSEHFGEILIKGWVGSLHGHKRNALQGAGGAGKDPLREFQNELVLESSWNPLSFHCKQSRKGSS